MQSDWLLKLRIVFAIHSQSEAVVTLGEILAVIRKEEKMLWNWLLTCVLCTKTIIHFNVGEHIHHYSNLSQ